MTEQTQRKTVRLSGLREVQTTTSVQYGEEVVEITFRRGFWTCEAESQYNDSPGSYRDKNIRLVLDNVKSWNITDDQDQMLAITEENLRMLDSYLLTDIVSAMLNRVLPNAQSSQD